MDLSFVLKIGLSKYEEYFLEGGPTRFVGKVMPHKRHALDLDHNVNSLGPKYSTSRIALFWSFLWPWTLA